MQFQSPSEVQAPVSAPAVEVVPDDAGDGAAEEGAGAAEEYVVPAGGSVAVVGMMTGAETTGEDEDPGFAVPAKTPPVFVGETAGGAGVVALPLGAFAVEPPLEPT